MSDTTPNLSAPNALPPSNQMHTPSAVALTQIQSDHETSIGIDLLLAASEMAHDEVYDETLLTQTPIVESPFQPIIAAVTQSSPELARLAPTNLFGAIDDSKHSYMKDSNGQAFQKKQKSRKGFHKMMHNFLRYE